MSFRSYAYALFISLVLTIIISKFHNVTNKWLQSILLTMLYIFVVHFAQGKHCLINGIIGLVPGYDSKKETEENKEIINSFGDIKRDLLSSLDSQVHADELYKENISDENRLESTSENDLYYSLTNKYYPMNSRQQINQKDCTNDQSCLIPEDKINMYPIKQSLGEVLPVSNIGPKEYSIMNELNPISINDEGPLPIESHNSYETADVSQFESKQTGCGSCGGNNDVKESFGLFETYRMDELNKPLYYDAPDMGNQICKNCKVGYCRGDLCTGLPFRKYTREDPLNM